MFNVAALPGDPGKHGAPAAWRPENAGAGVVWTAGGEPLAGGNPGRSEGLRGKDLSLRQEEGRRPGPREPCPPGALRLRQRTCNRPAPCCPRVMDGPTAGGHQPSPAWSLSPSGLGLASGSPVLKVTRSTFLSLLQRIECDFWFFCVPCSRV